MAAGAGAAAGGGAAAGAGALGLKAPIFHALHQAPTRSPAGVCSIPARERGATDWETYRSIVVKVDASKAQLLLNSWLRTDPSISAVVPELCRADEDLGWLEEVAAPVEPGLVVAVEPAVLVDADDA